MELLSKPNDEALLRSENAYWRNVADYNNSALQLYYYLRGVDWQKALAVHFASWQRNGVVKMETRAWDFGGYPWVGWYRDKSHPHGRLIQRYSIQHRFERARFARLVLPIPSPLEYAKRQLRQALELLTRQYSQSYEVGLATAPDKRLYSTNELKRISQELGQPALAGWEANAWLKTLLELNVTRREILAPAKAGAMLAKIDLFRLRWQDFHEAEKQVLAATPVPPLDTPAVAGNGPAVPIVGKKTPFCNGFRPEDADLIAREIGLINESGNIDALLTYKVGRLCGFYKQLQTEKKVAGNLEKLRDYFAERYKMEPISSKPNPKSYIALDTATETHTALKRLFLK